MKNPENSWSDILSPPAQERRFLRKDRLSLFQIPQLDGKGQHNGRNNGALPNWLSVTKAWQLQLSWGADLQVENGLRESERLLLRSVWLF